MKQTCNGAVRTKVPKKHSQGWEACRLLQEHVATNVFLASNLKGFPWGLGWGQGTSVPKELCESWCMPSTSVRPCAFYAFLWSTRFPAILGALRSLCCHKMLGCSNHFFFQAWPHFVTLTGQLGKPKPEQDHLELTEIYLPLPPKYWGLCCSFLPPSHSSLCPFSFKVRND